VAVVAVDVAVIAARNPVFFILGHRDSPWYVDRHGVGLVHQPTVRGGNREALKSRRAWRTSNGTVQEVPVSGLPLPPKRERVW